MQELLQGFLSWKQERLSWEDVLFFRSPVILAQFNFVVVTGDRDYRVQRHFKTKHFLKKKCAFLLSDEPKWWTIKLDRDRTTFVVYIRHWRAGTEPRCSDVWQSTSKSKWDKSCSISSLAATIWSTGLHWSSQILCPRCQLLWKMQQIIHFSLWLWPSHAYPRGKVQILVWWVQKGLPGQKRLRSTCRPPSRQNISLSVVQ